MHKVTIEGVLETNSILFFFCFFFVSIFPQTPNLNFTNFKKKYFLKLHGFKCNNPLIEYYDRMIKIIELPLLRAELSGKETLYLLTILSYVLSAYLFSCSELIRKIKGSQNLFFEVFLYSTFYFTDNYFIVIY